MERLLILQKKYYNDYSLDFRFNKSGYYETV